MLAWARHAVANSIETSKRPSLLSSPLLSNLSTLYVITPARADAPSGETDLDLLVRMVALYLPTTVPADASSPPPAAANGAANGISTQRQPDGTNSSAAAGTAQPPPVAPPPASKQVINLTSTKWKHYMIHDELFPQLPEDGPRR